MLEYVNNLSVSREHHHQFRFHSFINISLKQHVIKEINFQIPTWPMYEIHNHHKE
jgi:Tfp pilus assembly ATPase PilU